MPKYLGTVNVSAVVQAQKDIKKDDRFKLAVESFAKRERFYAVNNIANGVMFYYQKGKWFTPSDAKDVYTWLQSLGVGQIRMNRDTGKAVFLFFTDYREFGKLVLGKNDKLLKQLVAEGADLPPTPMPRTAMPDLDELAPDSPPTKATPKPAPALPAPSAPTPKHDGAGLPEAVKEFVNAADIPALLRMLSPDAKAKFIALLETL